VFWELVNGAWGGIESDSVTLLPAETMTGAGYLISYATGALIVNTGILAPYSIYMSIKERTMARSARGFAQVASEGIMVSWSHGGITVQSR
jgi:hypothetical protein